ncbi:ASCH domain-containing protein [Paraburkholderia dipogonis]|uniref:hypothetical protein n=1 Tax=Paraburkholderia dipogonis TaxID=1211383 RepID=UPI0038B941A4
MIKDVENRSWPTKFRGRVLIHASKGMTRAEYEDVKDFIFMGLGIPPEIRLPPREALARGGIVGIVTITDCVSSARQRSPWHIDGAFGFQIADAKPLPFVECKGALGFFDIPEDVAETLRQIHAKATP